MTVLVLAVLALAWIAVILPAAVRARKTAPASSAERFRRGLEVLAPRPGPSSSGRWVLVPASPDRRAVKAFRRSQQRRRKLLELLLVTAAVTLLAALYSGGVMWEIHIAADTAVAAYVFVLLETKRRREERVDKVRSLGQRRRRDQIRFFDPGRAPHQGATS